MLKKIMGAAATAVLGSILIATPAQASDAGACTAADGKYKRCAGSVQFEDNGEVFYIYDNEADGAGTHVIWYINNVEQPTMYWGGGAGTYGKFNRSAAEGAKIRFTVCVETSDFVFVNTCSSNSATA
jgi:hypothetical protein